MKEKPGAHLTQPPPHPLLPPLRPIPNVIKIGTLFNEKCMLKRIANALVSFRTISAYLVAAVYVDNWGT